jgi:hypothetical protein
VPTEDIYTVEAILNHRGPEHKREFLIKWKGFPADSNTWEPECNLLTCQNLLKKYWTKRLPTSDATSMPPHSNAEPLSAQWTTPLFQPPQWTMPMLPRNLHGPGQAELRAYQPDMKTNKALFVWRGVM